MPPLTKTAPVPRKQPPPNGNAVERPASDPLLARYDELNALWNKAEEDFSAMRVPHCVPHEVRRVSYGPPEENCPPHDVVTFLQWDRYNNQWRILVAHHVYYDTGGDEAGDVKPVAESPMDVRVKMAAHLGELRRKMKDAREAYIPEVAEAIAQMKQALAD
jgi:hypothetical protein